MTFSTAMGDATSLGQVLVFAAVVANLFYQWKKDARENQWKIDAEKRQHEREERAKARHEQTLGAIQENTDMNQQALTEANRVNEKLERLALERDRMFSDLRATAIERARAHEQREQHTGGDAARRRADTREPDRA